MKTDELIDQLGRDLRPVRAGPPAWLALAGLVGAALGVVVVKLHLGFRWDLAQAVGMPAFWIKAGYCLLLGLAGFWLAERLSRPVGSPRKGLILAGVVFAAMLSLALVKLAGASEHMRMHMWLGHSWTFCSRWVMTLALPVLAGTLMAMRRQAPAHPTLAGAAAGLFAGGIGAAVYGLACMEMEPAFIVTWYSLGILGSTALGAIAGRYVLRW